MLSPLCGSSTDVFINERLSYVFLHNDSSAWSRGGLTADCAGYRDHDIPTKSKTSRIIAKMKLIDADDMKYFLVCNRTTSIHDDFRADFLTPNLTNSSYFKDGINQRMIMT